MDRRAHWDRVYATKADREVSWFEEVPALSLRLIEAAGLELDTCVIDVGGGSSHLVDALVERGLRCVTVLDVSALALERARSRLAGAARIPRWIVADVTGDWHVEPVDVWHDRAVFHFLTEPEDRACYVAKLRESLKPSGTAIIGTFALDGPETCSGLPVRRYSGATLAAELGGGFALIESAPHVHRTPWGAAQSFQYATFRRARARSDGG